MHLLDPYIDVEKRVDRRRVGGKEKITEIDIRPCLLTETGNAGLSPRPEGFIQW